MVIFIDWFAPAYKAGGPIQSIVNLVNQQIEGVEYKIVCSNKDLDGQQLSGIISDKWIQFNLFTQVWYNSNNKQIRSVLRQLSDWRPDVFFINGIYSFYYNFLPLTLGKAPLKLISARGMLHSGALSQKSFKKKIYLGLWKLLGIPKKNCFHATNKEEKDFIHSAFGKRTIVFEAANFPRILKQGVSIPKQVNFLQLASIGLISPMKNYLEVIKALTKCDAHIEYLIYGPVKDVAYWKLCLEAIESLPVNIKVSYMGSLPSSDISVVLSNAHVFILPSKSENFGHAIYEALIAGKPVITSHNTPWNNLKASKAGWNISVNDYELSEAICFFAQADELELEEWCVGARQYALAAVDIEAIKTQYLKMFSNIS